MKTRKINPFLAAYVVGLGCLAVIGYSCADFTMHIDHPAKTVAEQTQTHTDVTFVDLPRLNLVVPSAHGSRGRLRMDITLEIDKKYALMLQGYTPRISERIESYAQAINIEDVTPPKATQQLRQDLLQEAATGGFPVPIIDVIFRQFVML